MKKNTWFLYIGFLFLINSAFLQHNASAGLKEKLTDPQAKAWLEDALKSDPHLRAQELQNLLNGPIKNMGSYFVNVFQREFRMEDIENLEGQFEKISQKYPLVLTEDKKTEIQKLLVYLKEGTQQKKIDEKFILAWVSVEKYFEAFQYFQVATVYVKNMKESVYRYLTYCLDDYFNVFKHLNRNSDKNQIAELLSAADLKVSQLKNQFDKFQNQNLYFTLVLKFQSLESAPQLAPTVQMDKVKAALVLLSKKDHLKNDLNFLNSVLEEYFSSNSWSKDATLTQKVDILKLQVICSYLNNQDCHTLMNSIEQSQNMESMQGFLPEALRNLESATHAEFAKDYTQIVQWSPGEARSLVLQNIVYFRFILDQLKERYLQNLTLSQKAFYWKKEAILLSIEKTDTALADYFTLLRKSTSLDELKVFFKERSLLNSFMGIYFESLTNVSPLTTDYSNYLEKQVKNKKNNRFSKIIDYSLFDLLKKERKEGVYNAWVNKENGLILTASASLAALAFVTCGTSLLATVPLQYQAAATLTLHSVSIANTVITRSIFAANATYNLAERYHQEGWNGLKNWDSLLDIMMIVTSLPELKYAKFAGVGKGVFLNSSQAIINSLVFTKNHLPAAWISFVGGRGVYYFYNSEKLSQELKAEGMTYVTAEDVRKEGLKQIALAARVAFVHFVVPTYGEPLPSPKVIIPSALFAPTMVSLPNLENY